MVEKSRRTLKKEFFPSDVFEATTHPDPAFNRLLMADLNATEKYFFRGFSGQHAAARLLLSRTERESRVIIADPRDAGSINRRARYLLRHGPADDDFEQIQARLEEEIKIGLVGLFLARHRCVQVDITVMADPPLDRLELFDDSVWVSLHGDQHAVTEVYPRTLRFTEASFIYNMERADFLRISQAPTGRHFRITPATTREDFLALSKTITGVVLSDEQFRELEVKFDAFMADFSPDVELGAELSHMPAPQTGA